MRRGHFHRAPLTALGSSFCSRREAVGWLKCDSVWTSRQGKTQYLWGISSVQFVVADMIACANASPDGTGLNWLKVWHCGKKESFGEKGLVRWNSAKWYSKIWIWITTKITMWLSAYLIHVCLSIYNLFLSDITYHIKNITILTIYCRTTVFNIDNNKWDNTLV